MYDSSCYLCTYVPTELFIFVCLNNESSLFIWEFLGKSALWVLYIRYV